MPAETLEKNMISLHAPLARASKTLDKSLFNKTLNLAAATVQDSRNISKFRKELIRAKQLLVVDRLDNCRADPVQAGKKCLLLRPDVKLSAPSTWHPVLQEGVRAHDLTMVPFEVHLDYDYWSYLDIMSSILPEELHDEIPVGFNTAGHVAHLNLRERYTPYKNLIAQVIMDKNPRITTVINKTDNVGTESAFRTFSYEVLAGPDDMDVEARENDCSFKFDYAKVYWNSKLEGEHTRLIRSFKPGEVVCDVMAGIGPFAVPAGKRGVFVFANDMNPESHRYLEDAIRRNKVGQYVRGFNRDGRDFIREAARLVREASDRGDAAVIQPKVSRNRDPKTPAPEPKRIPLPPTISHFVMNLPASATTFVRHFRGLYHGHDRLFEPHTDAKLPLVHVHCFAAKSEDEAPLDDICQRLYDEIGVRFTPGDNPDDEGVVSVQNVRDVAPAKTMYCATFRVPAEVAFAAPATS